MKIVDRKTFLTLPPGTAFQKGKRWYWGGLEFKTADQYENDWRSVGIDNVDAESSIEAFDRLEEMLTAGTSYPIETASTRDGCFDEDDLFLVYEAADLMHLSALIETAIVVATLPADNAMR